MLEIISWIFIVAGALLGIAGGIGIHRFPDFYSRLHAVGITDTLCAALFLIGLGLQTGVSIASLKLLLIFILLFFSSPTATHALADAAFLAGLKPELEEDNNEHNFDRHTD
ncbi:MAG: sodium:proton antiporter [Gammaproteobacteria bacterium]|nr:sodium:proton antiporter [Gammaproteobacteria bacterium]